MLYGISLTKVCILILNWIGIQKKVRNWESIEIVQISKAKRLVEKSLQTVRSEIIRMLIPQFFFFLNISAYRKQEHLARISLKRVKWWTIILCWQFLVFLTSSSGQWILKGSNTQFCSLPFPTWLPKNTY